MTEDNSIRFAVLAMVQDILGEECKRRPECAECQVLNKIRLAKTHETEQIVEQERANYGL